MSEAVSEERAPTTLEPEPLSRAGPPPAAGQPKPLRNAGPTTRVPAASVAPDQNQAVADSPPHHKHSLRSHALRESHLSDPAEVHALFRATTRGGAMTFFPLVPPSLNGPLNASLLCCFF